MVAPSINYEIRDQMAEGLSVRNRRKILKEFNGAAAVKWDRSFLGRHFRSGAATRYGYARRAPSTISKKKKLAERGVVREGGRTPLVHSGVLKDAMKRKHIIKATPRQGKVILHGPSYFNIRYRPGRPNLGAEVTAIIGSELQDINEASVKAGDAWLKKVKPRRKIIK